MSQPSQPPALPFAGVKEVALYVADLQRTHHFYHHTLGLQPLVHQPGRHRFYRLGHTVLLCFLADATEAEDEAVPSHGAHGHQHLALEVPAEAYEPTKAALQARGIAIEAEMAWQDGRWHSFYFRDPDGHSLEVVPTGMWGG